MTIQFTLNDNDSTVLQTTGSDVIPNVNDFVIINDKKYQVLTKIFQIQLNHVEIFVHEINY